jgi:septal ring factor EnvC (AmiA/AmiB activator)
MKLLPLTLLASLPVTLLYAAEPTRQELIDRIDSMQYELNQLKREIEKKRDQARATGCG